VGLVVDLLCFCIVSHSYRIKYYILRNNVVEKVLKLLRRRERWLVVAAIRFLRTALGMKVRLLISSRHAQPLPYVWQGLALRLPCLACSAPQLECCAGHTLAQTEKQHADPSAGRVLQPLLGKKPPAGARGGRLPG
jgi:hypothetical protein